MEGVKVSLTESKISLNRKITQTSESNTNISV